MKDEGKTREQLINEIRELRKQIVELKRTDTGDTEAKLEQTSMELAIGLSEVFEALKKISSGDPEVRIPEESEVELIAHLKHMVNMTAANIGEIVDQSHEFAMVLAEHFEVFHRVIKGNMNARIGGKSKVELLEALKQVSNKMIESIDREISERKKTEEALRESERRLRQSHERLEVEVRERTRELVKANEELARSNADLKDFAHVVSHDLKGPLHTIEGFAKLLARRYKGRIDAKADEFIRYIIDGTIRMEDLIKDLLEYSQLGVKAERAALTDCSLIVEKVIGNLKAAIEENHAVLTHDAMPTIIADPSQMISLFQNLIDNAIKFHGEERPRIHISAERKGEEWVFSVRDNGIGMNPEDSEKIFGMFQRLHSSPAYPGTGIGLATCRKIVESHGGKLWVDSEPGKGSTFYFTIPYEEINV